jgi:RimJ/RimL family protein N-acetyltransferase
LQTPVRAIGERGGELKGLAAMLEVAKYSAFELLRDGRRVEVRALRHSDRDDLLAAVARTSTQSLYRRFFGVKREFTEKEIAFFVDVDFNKHVALVAVVDQGGRQMIVGGGRYVVMRPEAAEVAFAVVDEFQGQGLGTALMRHLITIARDAGLKEFVAEVLPDNAAMLKVFEKSGLSLTRKREARVVHVVLQLL